MERRPTQVRPVSTEALWHEFDRNAAAIRGSGHPHILVTKRFDEAILPTKAHDTDAGYDMYLVKNEVIMPSEARDIDFGFSMKLPPGYFGRLTGRSSTWRRYKLLVIEGIIDNDYTGPMMVGVFNMGNRPVELDAGTRVAQLLVHRQENFHWREIGLTEQLPQTERGVAGFGSSGK